MDYTDDTDLNKKLAEWEGFYNFQRPHGALGGKAPYEVLREKPNDDPRLPKSVPTK